MNTDLKEMFNEKNQSLFLNKLIMDLDNNADTFKLVSKNIIKIEVAKLFSSLKRLYDKYNLLLKEEDIKEILSNTKNDMLSEINLLIDKKAENSKEFIESSDKNQKINQKYVKAYHKHVNDVEKMFEDNIKLAVCEIAEIGLYTSLTKKYPCANLEMQQELLEKVNVDFAKTLINRLTDESIHRNRTLKNISEETYNWFSNLNKTSAKIDQNSKKKVLKNN